MIFHFDAHVQVLANPVREPLPVPTNSNLPHTEFAFGPVNVTNTSALAYVLVESGASLTTRGLFFWTGFDKAFPECIRAVYTSESYAPITLSRIVQ